MYIHKHIWIFIIGTDSCDYEDQEVPLSPFCKLENQEISGIIESESKESETWKLQCPKAGKIVVLAQERVGIHPSIAILCYWGPQQTV